ncbi:AraC family transcriptional regulator [Paenibacillus arenilitoris]|uniref:AraC family transcriptional regulator ligand-binding domain-containing protein n=1 Tax=Paenibacillus arenilitoris TaxID=2772299 RepID=A0A927CSN5_9BACL|nr:AraC family transcriptional regulator [Paenibacillus arenilitoris]MBD2872482.1 AraC family transcriptional regulator ligand-binding domain-containing protein [Paenibacillus arenilitoris]
MTSHALDRIKIPAGFWLGLRQLDIAPHDVVRKARLPLTVLTETGGVTTAQYFMLWQALSDMVDDPAAGIIKMMTNFETTQLPPSVLAPYHARDYRDALHRMARYKQMCAPERFHIDEDNELCTIQLEWLYTEGPEPSMLSGVTIASLLEIGRRGTGIPLKADRVEFTCSMGDRQALEAHFGCPVHFHTGRNRLTLYRKDLDRPFLSYNAELLEILTPALDKMLDEYQRAKSVTQTVKWMIKRSLAAGRPDIQVIASELGMSFRTLQRRLTEDGTSFKQLLTDTRREQAQEYLSDPSIDIKEVAFLLGYEDQNSFYRAFRLWEGDTPSNWRADNR